MKLKIKIPYLFHKILLNYNCPADEKQGSGPGSCSDNKEDSKTLGGNFGNQSKTREKIDSPEYRIVLDKINIKNMDQKTKEVFRRYAEYEYANINKSLYNNDNNNNNEIKIMDNAFKNSKLISNFIAYRGIDINKVSKSELEKWTKKGSKIPLPGYVSTSIDSSVAFKHGKLQVELEIPERTNAIFMDDINPELATAHTIGGGLIGDEFELLLDRGYELEVTEPASPMFPDMNPDNPLFKWKAKAKIIIK